jgi:hypothetical protein
VDESVQAYRAWVGRFPRCDPGSKATEVDALPRDAEPQPVAARGILTVEANPQCTKKGCGGADCCNGCFPNWVLVPTETMPILKPYQREIAIQEAGQDNPLGAGLQDCVYRRLRERLPKARVIVTGTLQKSGGLPSETVTDASICVVTLPP